MSTQAQTLQKNRGGKRAKKQANHSEVRTTVLQVKDGGQEYAKILKVLGGCRFTCECYDGHHRLGILRGRLTKGKNKHENMIAEGDYVLVGLRDYEVEKCDIIIKYKYPQVKELIRQGELPESATAVERIGAEIEDDENQPFDFNNV